jgi:hypothetical protein
MRRTGARLGLLVGRSLIPVTALLIILGTMWWGPWVSLSVAVVWWYMAGRLV